MLMMMMMLLFSLSHLIPKSPNNTTAFRKQPVVGVGKPRPTAATIVASSPRFAKGNPNNRQIRKCNFHSHILALSFWLSSQHRHRWKSFFSAYSSSTSTDAFSLNINKVLGPLRQRKRRTHKTVVNKISRFPVWGENGTIWRNGKSKQTGGR